MADFMAKSKPDVMELEDKLAALDKSYATLAESYGEDPKTMNPEEFFGAICTSVMECSRSIF